MTLERHSEIKALKWLEFEQNATSNDAGITFGWFKTFKTCRYVIYHAPPLKIYHLKETHDCLIIAIHLIPNNVELNDNSSP